ncbi:MAG: hypothetical protein ACI8TQ_003301 [Planctomycetota bacterium]
MIVSTAITAKTPRRSVQHYVAVFLLVLVSSAGSARAEDLYYTNFEEFAAGDDQWAGTNGWVSNVTSGGVHGVDDEIVSGLDKTAFIGFNQPPSRFVTVFRPIGIDPVSNKTPVIRFESLMGIEDSTNGRGDSFFFSIYNQQGQFLAAIRFNNDPVNPGIWRLDGQLQFDTNADFIPGVLQLLFFEIDFANNTWSADFNGIPLFDDVLFHNLGRTLDLHTIAVEWQVASVDPALHGDNWMLIADWLVEGIPKGQDPLLITDTGANSIGMPWVSWPGEFGFTYAIEHTDNLSSWTSGLPNSVFSGLSETQCLSFVDASVPLSSVRYYRVVRSITP